MIIPDFPIHLQYSSIDFLAVMWHTTIRICVL
nr:MAG TPA: hypothetical protein [Caudoviricetes sp.]